MVFQHSPKYAVDVEPSIRSKSMATVYGKKSVVFTGGGYAGIKASLFTFIKWLVNICNQCIIITVFVFYSCLFLPPSVAGGWETNYSCCASAVGSSGCQVAKVILKHSTA